MPEDHANPKRLQSHRDLLVWQRGVELTLAVYKLTQGFPREESYGLTSQLRRAAVSIPSNIAEGYGRGTRRDYSHFLTIARGSNLELQTQLLIAGKLQFASEEAIADAERLSDEIGRMLAALLLKLQASRP